MLLTSVVYAQNKPDSLRLNIEDHYGKEAVLMVNLLERYHYRKIEFEDSLSAVLLNNYVSSLDNSKLYFYQSDIDLFNKHFADKLDNMVKSGDVKAAFNIYKVYEKRFHERMDYLENTLIDWNFDFVKDESYDLNKDNKPWPSSESEMNDEWRKVVKSQVLSLKLNEKPDDEIKKTILVRYQRIKKSISQYRNDDVFQLYLNELATAYDPHTNYFSPSLSERFQQDVSLSLEGIGARLVTDNDYTKVVEILPGGPAYKAKSLHPNDLIVGVGQGKRGEMIDVIGWRIDDVVKLIKGPKGTWVRLKVLPAKEGLGGKTIELLYQREKIKLEDQAVTSSIMPIERNGKSYNIGLITVPSFYLDFEAFQKGDVDYNSTTRDVREAIEKLKAQNMDGLVIDLRNNGGGSLMEAIDLTGLFIKNGPVVQVRDTDNSVDVGLDEDDDITWEGPLTVMINRFSASASEIFSGAIQDYKRGIVIGEQSYGKGTVQRMVDLKELIRGEKAEFGFLKLTLQKFYRINGSSTQHKGVMPDIEFPSAFDRNEFGESSLASALPWDQISGTDYQTLNQISDELIQKIKSDFEYRSQNDLLLKEYLNEIRTLRTSMTKTSISLNEEKRKNELEKSEKEDSIHEGLDVTVNTESGSAVKDNIPTEDEFLREGIIILTYVVDAKVG